MKRSFWAYFLRAFLTLAIFGAGVAGFEKLRAMRKPPATEARPENVLRVQAVIAQAETIAVELEGFGTVRSASQVTISPEVKGRVQKTHPKLEVGGIVNKGAMLVQLDDEEYRLMKDRHLAELTVLEAQVDELRTELSNTETLIAFREKQQELAKSELTRVQELFEGSRIGSQSQVDKAMSAWITAKESLQALQNARRSIPASIETLNQRIQQTKRQVALEELNIKRCIISAPFSGRILNEEVEVGQAINPGQNLLTLVDDSRLEILVSLNGADAVQWLNLDKPATREQGWFPKPQASPATIIWAGAKDNQQDYVFQGLVDRIQEVDTRNRTVQLVISISEPWPEGTPSPLVAGMFCKVTIPGKSIEQAFRIPRVALQGVNDMYVSEDGRLAQRRVTIAHETGDDLILSTGLKPGDEVITSRIITPIIGMRVSTVAEADRTALASDTTQAEE